MKKMFMFGVSFPVEGIGNQARMKMTFMFGVRVPVEGVGNRSAGAGRTGTSSCIFGNGPNRCRRGEPEADRAGRIPTPGGNPLHFRGKDPTKTGLGLEGKAQPGWGIGRRGT